MAGINTIPTQNAMQTTLGGTLALGETGSATLAADWSTQLATTSATRVSGIVIDRVDASGTKTPTKREYISFTGISGTTITGLVRGLNGSSDQAHAAGAIVELVTDVSMFKSIADTLDVQHNISTGVHDAATVTTLKASGAEVTTGTEDAKIVTPKALTDAGIVATPVKASAAEFLAGSNDTKFITALARATAASVKIGYFDRDVSTASGDQAITGVGFKPKGLILFSLGTSGTTDKICIGLSDPVLGSMNINLGTGTGWTRGTASIVNLYYYSSAPNYVTAVLKTMDTDGFTLTWTKNGSPTGTAVLVYLAFQ